MKKALSLFLCFMTIASCVVFSASAMSYTEGLEALEQQFADGKNSFDYVYYTPVKKTSDTKKYPLIIWLHGQFSGNDKRYQLENCEVALWSSEEYQARINNAGGAFIFLPRDPTLQTNLAWNGEMGKLKSSIDEFVRQYKKNIDTTRIYIGGFSMGGKAALKMGALYPKYFAAVFAMSPVNPPSASELRYLKDTPVWLFSCVVDTLVTHATINSVWNTLKANATNKSNIRWSSYSVPLLVAQGGTSVHYTYLLQHNTWDAVAHDLFMDTGKTFPNITTIDGNGKRLSFTYPNGFLDWVSLQDLDNPVVPKPEEPDEPVEPDEPEQPEAPSSSVLEALEKMVELFLRIFKLLFR